MFVRYGPGTIFTNINTTQWQVNYNAGMQHEVIVFSMAPRLIRQITLPKRPSRACGGRRDVPRRGDPRRGTFGQ
jgi:hypothetical protein